MLIRERVVGDEAACLDMLRQVHQVHGYPLHLRPEELEEFLWSADEAAAWVAEDDGRVVGHVALHTPTDDPVVAAAAAATGRPEAELPMVCRLFIALDQQRTGLGRQLLRHATVRAASLGQRAVLDVGHSLTPAIALYESEGWQRVAELHLPLPGYPMLDLWVYVSPEPAPY